MLLDFSKKDVELLLLIVGKRKADWLGLLQGLIELEKLLAEVYEVIVEGDGGFREDIAPLKLEIHVVEDEARE